MFVTPKILRHIENENYKRIVDERFMQYETQKTEILYSFRNGYKLEAESVGITSGMLKTQEITILAEIDQDGFYLPYIEDIELNFVPLTTKENFMERERFKIFLVIVDGFLGIKKNYQGNKYRFLKELESLYKLSNSNINIPSILDIDFDNLTIVISYIDGEVLREKLAQKGARIRDKQVGRNSEYSFLKRKILVKDRLKEGRKFLPEVIDKKVVTKLFQQLDKIHKSGIIINDIKYGNIIIENSTKEPFFIDFETATILQNNSGLKHKILSNFEKQKLIEHFKNML